METTNKKVSSKKLWKIAFLAIAVLGIVFLLAPKIHAPEGGNVKIKGENIKVTIVTTEDAQAMGLGGRKEIGADEGMLFVFDTVDKHSIWMKDMLFPIDIIWINENKDIITIKENATPDTYPSTFEPNEDAKYVLEVGAFYTRDHKVEVGDKVEF